MQKSFLNGAVGIQTRCPLSLFIPISLFLRQLWVGWMFMLPILSSNQFLWPFEQLIYWSKQAISFPTPRVKCTIIWNIVYMINTKSTHTLTCIVSCCYRVLYCPSQIDGNVCLTRLTRYKYGYKRKQNENNMCKRSGRMFFVACFIMCGITLKT